MASEVRCDTAKNELSEADISHFWRRNGDKYCWCHLRIVARFRCGSSVVPLSYAVRLWRREAVSFRWVHKAQNLFSFRTLRVGSSRSTLSL